MEPPARLSQYAKLIESFLGKAPAFQPIAEDHTHIQVERGLRGPTIKLPAGMPVQIVDAGGHARPVYRPLLIYSWIINELVERCDPWLADWISTLGEGAWPALVRHAAAGRFPGYSQWADYARKVFGDLVARQQPNGALLPEDIHANPETRWYLELTTLHALAGYAAKVDDARINSAIERCALYHLQETQPDHATAQPWGLLAFIQFAPALADQVLHALAMQYPASVTGVPLLLLNDVRYGLRQLSAKEPRS
jgi:hypothetical protein